MIVDEFLAEKLRTNNPELIAAGIRCMKYFSYAKGEVIVKTGEPISMYRFLAKEGLVRFIYHTVKGKEITECVVSQVGNCIMPSAVLDKPSPIDMEALTDVGIIAFPIDAVRNLEEQYPEVLRMENEALTECWREQWEMKRVRYEYDAKKRYLWFCRTHPGAADRMMNMGEAQSNAVPPHFAFRWYWQRKIKLHQPHRRKCAPCAHQ